MRTIHLKIKSNLFRFHYNATRKTVVVETLPDCKGLAEITQEGEFTTHLKMTTIPPERLAKFQDFYKTFEDSLPELYGIMREGYEASRDRLRVGAKENS